MVAEMVVGRVLTKSRGRQSHTVQDSEGEQVERAEGRARCDEEVHRGWWSVSGGKGRLPGRAGGFESVWGGWGAVRRCNGECQGDKTAGRTRREVQTIVRKPSVCQTGLQGQYCFP